MENYVKKPLSKFKSRGEKVIKEQKKPRESWIECTLFPPKARPTRMYKHSVLRRQKLVASHNINDKILTPMKQTSSWLQMVLLGLLMDGGQWGALPSQKLASRQPLSSRHLSPNLSLQSAVQHGPCERHAPTKRNWSAIFSLPLPPLL